MTRDEFTAKLIAGWPGAEWVLPSDDLDALEWFGPGSQPSLAEIEAVVIPEPQPSTDPADYPLEPAQFKALVDYLGKDSAIRLAIANIPDALQRSWALSRYLNAKSYLWTDAFLQQMRAAVGMTEEELSEAWMLAKDLKSE